MVTNRRLVSGNQRLIATNRPEFVTILRLGLRTLNQESSKNYNQKNPCTHKIKLAPPPPPPVKKKTQTRTPLKQGILWACGFSFSSTEKKNPGTHKIGAAISGPRIAGRKIMDLSGRLAGDSTICGRLGGPNSAIAACGFAIWGVHQKGPF